MDNKKDDKYYVEKIAADLAFILAHTKNLTQNELEHNEILIDSVMFRLIQVAESSEKLTEQFKACHSFIPWRAMKGMRNRIVHEYGHIDLSIVYQTIKNDIPKLLQDLKSLVS